MFGAVTTVRILQTEKLEPTITCYEQMTETVDELMLTIIFYLVIITVIFLQLKLIYQRGIFVCT